MTRSVHKRRLGRRTFLRGSLATGGGLALALPTLEIMLNDHGTAHADGSPLPCRFGVFYWGNGVIHDEWIPDRTGMSWDLPPALAAFDGDLRPYVTQVTGTSHQESRPGHIPYRGLSLSSSHHPQYVENVAAGKGYRNQAMPAPSVDQIVARQMGEDARWIGVGICRRGPYKSRTSWVEGGEHREHYSEPQRVFDRLFAGLGQDPDIPTDPMVEARRRIRLSMIDAVAEDARQLSRRVGMNDRHRIDAHLEALLGIAQELETRAEMPPSTCNAPGSPTTSDFGDGSTREEKQAKHDLMRELLAVALACDLTRVFSYEWSANQSEAVYWEVDQSGQHHDLSHGNAGAMRAITRFIMDRYAELGRSLLAMPEGDGNLLDRTVILGTSEHANGAGHNSRDFPMLFLGRAGLRAGQHYRDPAGPGSNANTPRVLLTACYAVGTPVPSLGHDSLGSVPERVATEPIGELLAG